jgi:predicted hydrocarbon binding protein
MSRFSSQHLEEFIEIVTNEIGAKNLPVVLEKSGFPPKWAQSEFLKKTDAQTAAESYAGIQQAIRIYYGRGARGMLQRIGSNFWNTLIQNASFKERTQAKLLRPLPNIKRRKSALELLPRLLDLDKDAMRVHTLDLNLLLVDKLSPTTYNQHSTEAICHVTHGLIREALYWATAQDALIEEIACKANGAENCEFKITFGEN